MSQLLSLGLFLRSLGDDGILRSFSLGLQLVLLRLSLSRSFTRFLLRQLLRRLTLGLGLSLNGVLFSLQASVLRLDLGHFLAGDALKLRSSSTTISL